MSLALLPGSGPVMYGGQHLYCWLCSASAGVIMGHVYGALLVAVLVVQ